MKDKVTHSTYEKKFDNLKNQLHDRIQENEKFLLKYRANKEIRDWNSGYDQAISEEVLWLRKILDKN